MKILERETERERGREGHEYERQTETETTRSEKQTRSQGQELAPTTERTNRSHQILFSLSLSLLCFHMKDTDKHCYMQYALTRAYIHTFPLFPQGLGGWLCIKKQER